MIRSVRLSRLLRDRTGVTALEFAIILPGMLTLVCGALEMGHMIFARVALEGAVVEAARNATASLETAEGDRAVAMRAYIERTMGAFATTPGRTITIQTRVYKDFSTAYPENFTDTNSNGKYDFGEPYVDRNANGKWDPATPIGGTLGGPGDVVSYTAIYPKRILFGFLSGPMGLGQTLELKATTVVRNESVVRRTT